MLLESLTKNNAEQADSGLWKYCVRKKFANVIPEDDSYSREHLVGYFTIIAIQLLWLLVC